MSNVCLQPCKLSLSTSATRTQEGESPKGSTQAPSCPQCQKQNSRVLETKLRKDGIRRRKLQCRDCGHEYIHLEKEKPRDYSYESRPQIRRFTEEQAIEIIRSRRTPYELAEKYGVSHQSIRQMQQGTTYREIWKKVYPSYIPGNPGASCYKCVNWKQGTASEGGVCRFEFPEASDPRFATECLNYQAKTKKTHGPAH